MLIMLDKITKWNSDLKMSCTILFSQPSTFRKCREMVMLTRIQQQLYCTVQHALYLANKCLTQHYECPTIDPARQDTTTTTNLPLWAFHWGFQADTFFHHLLRPTTPPEGSTVVSGVPDQPPSILMMGYDRCHYWRQQQIRLKTHHHNISHLSVSSG